MLNESEFRVFDMDRLTYNSESNPDYEMNTELADFGAVGPPRTARAARPSFSQSISLSPANA